VKLKVTPMAWEELRGIEEYIGQDNPKAAVAFVQRLIERMNELCESPGIGRKRDDLAKGIRSSRVSDYLIFYYADGDMLVIVHVLHGRRSLHKVFEQDS
jgi:toxin ParE1/3/4